MTGAPAHLDPARTDPLEEVCARVARSLGEVERNRLGEITLKDVCRYAIAVGDDEYAVAARADEAAGRVVVAPPMFLTAIFSWADGPPEAELRPDGMGAQESPCTEGLPVRQVHGGQAVRLLAPVRVGTTVHAERSLTGAERKRGKAGDFVVLGMRTEYVDDFGTPLVVSEESVILLEDDDDAA
jgi:acyl dehydratase